MSLKAKAFRNVSATWLALIIQAATSFFVSPILLHRLGDESFSLWILIFAVTGYFGLLDLGIRSAVVRYTARFTASRDFGELGRYLSTALAFFGMVALVVALTTILGCVYLDRLFHIPRPVLHDARILFALSGFTIALSFPLGVFAGVLEGLQKFFSLHLSQIAITIVRAGVMVFVLFHGYGLVTIGVISALCSLGGYVIFGFLAIRALPFPLVLRKMESSTWRKMAGYGFFALAITAAERLRFQSDALVIGTFLSSSAIAWFAIGSKLVEYSSYAVRSMAQIFTPMSSQFEAEGDRDRLRRMLFAGNQACALIVFPLCIALAILGKPVIECWVGARYVASYPVLLVLLVPRTLYLAQSTSTKILLGLGRHRALAGVLLLEGLANVVLSIILIRPYGILGVAAGTAIPLLCTSLVFLPRHLCRILDVSLGEFLVRTYRLPLILCLPLVPVLMLFATSGSVHDVVHLATAVTVGVAVYAAGFGVAVWERGMGHPLSWRMLAQVLEPK